MKFPTSLGESQSKVLASAWANRMQFLFEADQQGLLAQPEVRAQTLEAYSAAEPEDFVELMDSGAPEAKEHGERIRAIMKS
eukprot:264977-Lingulodinium_polyedra.AAC.1